ncbi:MAG TPA: prenyltransferase/squalene oxidase repeat-containing protein [Thermoplasmata archaeon]|nr:prenyltransferase/squalene oxidase repeat-containing protein [Thermoplasmata archaeon]
MARTASVLDWLLEPDQPAMRYRALRNLLGRPDDDPEVRAARREIPKRGWAHDLLKDRDPEGWWVDGGNLYLPKYLATNWKLLVLADLGLSRELPEIERSCRLWIDRFATEDGGFGISGGRRGHHCLTGNMTRALLRFGYSDHPRVQRAVDWLLATSSPLGGWSCFGSGRNLDSWEGLGALAVWPRARWTEETHRVVDRACEFYLERELRRQGPDYPPWRRFHYPVHYYYDLLVGLELLTTLGHGADPRLRFALDHLAKRRGKDGRWTLDGVHPDVEGRMADWYRAHPKRRPTPLALEEVGAPSKIITYRALRVVERVRPGSVNGAARPKP